MRARASSTAPAEKWIPAVAKSKNKETENKRYEQMNRHRVRVGDTGLFASFKETQ